MSSLPANMKRVLLRTAAAEKRWQHSFSHCIMSICALEKRGIYSGRVTFYKHVSFVLFVWVDDLRPGSTAEVMSGRSVSYPPSSWASLSEAGNQYLAHILSPLTDNCSS